MTGIITKFSALAVLEKTLSSSGDPEMARLGDLINRHSAFAHLGSLCDSVGDFAPVRVESSGQLGSPGSNPYVTIWKLIFDVFGGDGSPENPGLKPLLDKIRGLLSQLDTIAAAEDLDALMAMEGEVNTINEISANLDAVITRIKGDGTLNNLGMVLDFQQAISSLNRPAIVKERSDGKVGFPERFWTLREFLAWRRSGDFAKELWDKALSSGSEELQAYALGWISSWSLNAGGSSAIASIVGAPYRNQWWRTRFVSNYIDLWTHGFYQTGASMSGDIPTPGYDTWPNLCSSEQHKKIEIPGITFDAEDIMKKLRMLEALPKNLPDFFTDYWTSCYENVYGDLGTERPKVNAEILQDAYAMVWLVLWFQTSPQSLGCHASTVVTPASCGSAPSWTDPTSAGGGGSGGGAIPEPSINPMIDEAAIGCAIFLLILGILLIIGGGYAAGGAAIAGAIITAANSGTIDWDKFRCDLEWYKLFLHNALRALHDLLSLGGFVHPYTHELAQDQTLIELLEGFDTNLDTGKNILKTQVKERYPLVPWSGAGFWFDPPGGDLEQPATQPAIGVAYPSGFISDPANPLGTQSTFSPVNTWPFNADANGNPKGFKNSVESMVEWLQSGDFKIPNLNMDGDRGLGFAEWFFNNSEWTNPVNINQP